MTKLEQVRAIAKRDATRLNRALAILNLNPYSPLYVVREVPKATRPGELVEIVQPESSERELNAMRDARPTYQPEEDGPDHARLGTILQRNKAETVRRAMARLPAVMR